MLAPTNRRCADSASRCITSGPRCTPWSSGALPKGSVESAGRMQGRPGTTCLQAAASRSERTLSAAVHSFSSGSLKKCGSMGLVAFRLMNPAGQGGLTRQGAVSVSTCSAALANWRDQPFGFLGAQDDAHHVAAGAGTGSFDCRNRERQVSFENFRAHTVAPGAAPRTGVPKRSSNPLAARSSAPRKWSSHGAISCAPSCRPCELASSVS